MKDSRIVSVLTASLFGLSTAAFANVYSFTSLPGATLDGLPVSATAQFTTAPGTITLALTNNISNPTSVIQAISDIFFTASGVTGGGGLQTPTANLVTIGDDKSPLVGNPQWLLTNTSGNNYHLDALAGPATGPATLIIGPGPYTNANGSIDRNDPHNPFINTSATWTLAFAGATASTVISNVVFSFGTQPGENVPACRADPGRRLAVRFRLVGVGRDRPAPSRRSHARIAHRYLTRRVATCCAGKTKIEALNNSAPAQAPLRRGLSFAMQLSLVPERKAARPRSSPRTCRAWRSR